MKILDNEKYILNIIKYGAIVAVVIFSLIITNIFIEQKKQDLNSDIQTLKKNYLNQNKIIIKKEIYNVIDLINGEIKKSEESLKKSIKKKVYEAYKVANSLYQGESKDLNDNGHYHSKKHILETIKRALTGMSYNNDRGYFFMDDVNGVKILQPFNKAFEGKNMMEFEDAKGYKFVKKISQTIKDKTEAYDKYYWYKPNDKTKVYEKISFYKYFAPYNAVIGTGEYVVDFEQELKEKILDWIKKIRYGDNGYIFIYDKNGVCLSHIVEENIGKNRLNIQDKNKNYPINDIITFAKEKKEGYINYLSTFNNNMRSSNKISYVELFEKWDWVIGTGFYLDGLSKDIKQREKELVKNNESVINKILRISILVTILLVAISFYISNIISKRFTQYKNNIQEEINKTIEKEKLLVQQSRMAVMGEMIGNIAHQWKQPLSLISMSNTLVKLNKEQEGLNTQEEINEAIENIDNSVIHLSTTIDDFRNFFDPHKKKTLFSTETILEKTFKLINSEFKTSNIEIIKNIDSIKISGYQNELLQVLINIIKNAKDEFLKKDTNNKQYLFIDTYKENNNVYIKIRDNVGGIPEDIINEIFTPYFTTKKDSDGTGIGLYMSRQIIENMDGKLEVANVDFEYKNQQFKGAEFQIILPIDSEN
ncbi:MAG: histidine kinase [Arcobacter sp.]|uniref:sensor histidine kinase n=1 Tax=uncultured Arcobacter sp. TaxID=165434 RepID=UPI000CAAB648|nr:cache domain-containing protein [uncultured Arcobacter sp.]PLY09178.1 MAG: histidine kinase [Arcobacter sp.]